MSHHAANALAKQMIEIASLAKDVSNDAFESAHSFNMHDGVMYSLSSEQQMALRALSQDLIKKSKSSEKISERHAFKATRTIFAGVISADTPNEHNTSLEIAAAMKAMEQYEVEQTVYLRVQGLRLDQPLKLGNVEFVMCSAEVAEKHIAEIYEKIDFPLDNGDPRLSDRFSEYFGYHCLAITTVIGEPLKAFERAHDETRRSLEILRFASVHMNFGKNVKFGLDGDQSLADSVAFVSSLEAATGDLNPEGLTQPFRLDAQGLENLEKIGALKLAGFLAEPKLSQFKESLLRAVHWLSSAITQSEKENKYLHLVIALEALFTPPKGDPISNTIAESTALVMNKTLTGRLQIKAFVKKCYDTRSTIAHGGKSPVTDKNLWELTIIVWNVIRSLLNKTDDFQNQTDLRAHLENLKFS